jgi:DNA-binding NarL/FixJ family response regulator
MQKPIAVSIVEDQEDIRQGMQKIFSNTDGFVCRSVFENAEDAVLRLPLDQPDVVIMDINLPGMTGIEAIRQLKSAGSPMQFMMFTIYENSEHVLNALAAGASGYLLKNTPADKILEAVKELHEGGSPMNSHIARKLVVSFQKTPPSKEPEAYSISAREREILELLSKGLLYKEISHKLDITTGTVKQHIHKIYEKLHVQNRTEALLKVFGSGGK